MNAEEIMQQFLDVCPSFRPLWEEYFAESYSGPDKERLIYVDLGQLAYHLVQLALNRSLTEFPEVFSLAERLHVQGNEDVRNAVCLGLLESTQNSASHTNLDADCFVRHLGPDLRQCWIEVRRGWFEFFRHQAGLPPRRSLA